MDLAAGAFEGVASGCGPSGCKLDQHPLGFTGG